MRRKLRARSRGLLTHGVAIEDPQGQSVANYEGAGLRSAGALTLDGRRYDVRRWGLVRQRLELADDGDVVIRAGAQTVFAGLWRVEAGSGAYALRRTSAWSGRWKLGHAGATVGELRREGWLATSSTAEFDLQVPLEVCVVALVLVRELERQNASPVATAGA